MHKATVDPVDSPVNAAVTDAGRWADHVAAIRSDTERMAAAFEAGPVDAPVAACPGWDVRKLIEHMAYIHRWAGFAVRNGRAPEAGDVAVLADTADTAEMAAWLRAGGTALADDLAAADPQADTWHVFPAPQEDVGVGAPPGAGDRDAPLGCRDGDRRCRRRSTRRAPPRASRSTSNWVCPACSHARE